MVMLSDSRCWSRLALAILWSACAFCHSNILFVTSIYFVESIGCPLLFAESIGCCVSVERKPATYNSKAHPDRVPHVAATAAWLALLRTCAATIMGRHRSPSVVESKELHGWHALPACTIYCCHEPTI